MENQHFESGKDKYKNRDFEGAVIDFTHALEAEPDNPYFYYERGLSYFHLNKKSLSLLDMNKAQELQPNNPYRYSSRAYIKDACGDLLGAIEDYKRALELDPADAVAHNNLGLLEEKLGRGSKAQYHFQQADDLSKQDGEFRNFYSVHEGVKVEDSNPAQALNDNDNELSTKRKPSDLLREVGRVFRSREARHEFVTFVKNGFRFKRGE